MNGEINWFDGLGHNPSYIYRGIQADIWDGGHRIPFAVRRSEMITADTISQEAICRQI